MTTQAIKALREARDMLDKMQPHEVEFGGALALLWFRDHADALIAMLEWRPIETAPRDGTPVLVCYFNAFEEWRVHEAQWLIPYEAAPHERGWWSYGRGTTLLDKSVHGIGASHWKPLPAPPEAP